MPKEGGPDRGPPEDWQDIDTRTGTPVGIDKGWDHAPGATVTPIETIAVPAIQRLPTRIGSNFGDSLTDHIDHGWNDWVTKALAGEAQRPGLVATISNEVLSALEKAGLPLPASAEVMVRPGLLHGPKAIRHGHKGDALEEALAQSARADGAARSCSTRYHDQPAALSVA